MSGLPWFELDTDFHEHPKTVALQVALKNPTAEAYVSRVWAYCYHHATDRFEGAPAVTTIEKAAGWRGKAGRLVAVLVEVGFLDREGGALVAHGVADRLGPHLAHRDQAAERQRRRRAALRSSREEERDVTRDVPPPSRPQTDRDMDRDKIVPVIQSVTEPRLAGINDFRVKLQGRLGVPLLSIGKNPKVVLECFEAQLAAVGEDALLVECCDLARKSTNGTPASLAWFVGWLNRLPTPAQHEVSA